MHILFLTQLLPLPLDAGPKTRSYYVLRYLAEAGHKVTLACFLRAGDRQEDIGHLRKICGCVETIPMTRSRLRDCFFGSASLFLKTPFLILRDQIGAMRRKIEMLTGAGSFDAIHADQLWMAPYGSGSVGAPLRVLDQHNAVFMVFQRMAQHIRNPLVRAALRKEASKLEAFERDVCASFDRVVWVTEEDRRAVKGAGNGRNGRDKVIPIAIDPSIQPPVPRRRPFRVTFVAGMHWPPNAEGISWFVDTVWPTVAEAVPGAVLTVIGKKPPRNLARLPRSSRVEALGYVSDLGEYLSETAVFVVPLRSGAGMRVKILDAWCWQLPVVSTSVGAEGIRSVPGENLLIADDVQDFAQSVIEVMRNRQLALRLSENGRATAEENYNWRKVYSAWDQIYH